MTHASTAFASTWCRSSNRRGRRVVLSALLASLLLAGPAAAGDIELRGTLLCRVEGDARRERPIESQLLVIEPVGHPQGAEVIGEAGLFRLRVPEEYVDHQLILRVHHATEEVHSMTIFLDAGRVRRVGDRKVCQLGAYTIPGSCEERTGTAAEAVSLRDQIRQGAGTTQAAARPRLPKPVWGGGVAAVVGGGIAALAGGSSGADFTDQGIAGTGLEPRPENGPLYSQFCTTPLLGRTLTSRRGEDEAALWNPSALVFAPGGHLAVAYGEENDLRASASLPLPVAASAPAWVPRTAHVGFHGFLGDDERVIEHNTPGDRTNREIENHDLMGTAGFGWRLGPEVAASVAFRGYWQKRGTIDRTTLSGEPPVVVTDVREHASRGVDVSLTWDARSDIRFAAATYSLFGGEFEDSAGQHVPLSRGVLGASWNAGRWAIGAETGLNTGDLTVALGIDYRATPWLGLSVAGGSRWETLQAGADVTLGPVTGRARIRRDTFEKPAGHFGLLVRY
jgi:hypothetical protein